MDLMYESHVNESAEVFRILMLGFMAISITYVFGTLLTANGSLKILNIVAASGMVINLLINLILVPKMMAVGSAYASLITQFTTAIIQTIIALRLFRFKPDYKYLFALLVFIAGVILITNFTKQIFENWIFNFVVMIIASVVLAMLLKLLNIKGFVQILKSKETM